MEEELPAARPAYTIGQDVSTFSVEELISTVALLREEIGRLEGELQAKDTTKAAAEALFRRQ
ncbi:DUF1192 domain-containing protein [Chelativorans intermedius]|uniref:DUF1192 domain-containing protein n=1 Tax=Chelativorans intermedius TaxID=515947 RepID=A0ABV6D9S3_9HYPH|nr:DUF1192 domain-containing protein [Chelativorans intermedius]MCT8997830.1 DUF1192 domain-containing protein [Chelativorans intermedius]